MLYLIGLGLNCDGISFEGLKIAKKCRKVYLENYTVEFPYAFGAIKKLIDKRIIPADREFVEGMSLVDEAKKQDVALLVYGSPLSATTHITLINECKASGVKCKIIHSASVFDAVAETGLQLYKFGKTTSMPAWKKNFTPDSFVDVVKENQSINAHTLILIDIGLNFQDALEQLEKSAENKKMKLNEIVVCSKLGIQSGRIYFGNIQKLREKEIEAVFCFIVPSEKLHHLEKEGLEEFLV